METQALTAHLPRPLAEKVDELAARLERSPEWIVRQALTSWIEQEEERRRLTLEGLADVDSSRLVEQASLQAWAESLGTDEELPVPQPGWCESGGPERPCPTLPDCMTFSHR